jgi:hypothetical protein
MEYKQAINDRRGLITLSVFISNLIGFLLCCLAILPPFVSGAVPFDMEGVAPVMWNLGIPIMVNSYLWCYWVIISGLLVGYFCFLNVPILIKIMACYIYISCFVSSAPYISFNAMLVLIPCFYLFLLIRNKVDKEVIFRWLTALFWFELIMSIFQYFGKDTLINFNRPQRVFLGTVMQTMRTGSLFAILAPFLILKNKWYIIPLIICAFLTFSSAFALALFAGIFVYLFLVKKDPNYFPNRFQVFFFKYKKLVLFSVVILAIIHSLINYDSFGVAFSVGRIPVWKKIVGTGLGAQYTAGKVTYHEGLKQGIYHFFVGRGLNMFSYLYPVLIKDANPFAQCHNDWLEIWWTLGMIGLSLLLAYIILLIRKLYRDKKILWIAGLVIIGINMFFAFPLYMPPQTPLLLLTYLALCQKEIPDASRV